MASALSRALGKWIQRRAMKAPAAAWSDAPAATQTGSSRLVSGRPALETA